MVAERLNAAIYSYYPGATEEELHLEAIFSRDPAEPPGAIRMTTLFDDVLRGIDEETLRSRAYRFTQHKAMAEVLSNAGFGQSCDEEAHVLVCWQGDGFQPPFTLPAMPTLQHAVPHRVGDYSYVVHEAVDSVKSTLLQLHAPIAFVLGIQFSEEERKKVAKMAGKIVDKALLFVGEIPEEDGKESGEKKRKRGERYWGPVG